MMNPTENQAPSPPKKGCGCWFWGCMTSLGLVMILAVGGYFLVVHSTNFLLSDQWIQWGYVRYARPQIESILPANLSPSEKKKILSEADATLQDFLNLPEDEKAQLKKEALIGVYYYSQKQIIPPEKIPHLIRFIEVHADRFKL